jgi:single-strand DNA-binding protein
MLNLNRATIIGHMTRDPELRSTPNGQSVANFSVATNRRWTSREGEQQEETEFHDVVSWGKLAEIADQILSKGNLVYIEGRLQTRSWEAQDGSKRQRTEIVADNIINLERRESGNVDQGGKKESFDQRPKQEKSSQADTAEDEDGDEEIDIDDIPL